MKDGTKRTVLNAFHSFFHFAMDVSSGPLLEVAHEAVATAEAQGGTGSEKLIAAKNTVLNDPRLSDFSFASSAVNLAIEIAVTALKAAL